MKAFWGDLVIRRLLLARLGEGVVLVVIIAACIVGYTKTREAETAVEVTQVGLALRPQYLLRLSNVQRDLRSRSTDVARILRLVRSSSEIVSFIAELEETAQGRKIVLEVPSITEVQAVDEAGEPVDERGPFRLISLKISAHGRAEDLLQYVHDLEYAPYLVSLEDWHVSTTTTSSPVLNSAQGALEVGDVPTTPVPVVAASQLDAELILGIHNEKYSL